MSKPEETSGDHNVHAYDDDLVEEDNHLPLWWLFTLYGAILFAVFYWYGEHELNAWPAQDQAFQKEMLAVRLDEAKKSGAMTSEALVAMSKNPETIAEGQQTFTTTCAPCHRADGGGNIGPNLTDAYWIHGSAPKDIWTTIENGVPAKGMPTWGPQLGEGKVSSVAAYVVSLRDTNVANGKPPQGDKAE